MNPVNIIYYWKPIVEVLILWLIIYHILLFFEGTRTMQVFRGIIVILIAFFLFEKLNLQVLSWLMTKLFGISVIAILVIFHPEIRQGLARLGQRNIFGTALREEELDLIFKELGNAIENLAKNKMGALVAIEKNVPLTAYVESGVLLDSLVSSELIEAVFTPNNPLHDGGLIIQNGRVVAAGCLFPLTHNQDLSRIYGTRHRAALGLGEVTDAIIVVVSEERGDMSLVYKGKFHRDLSREDLLSMIKEIIKLKR
jgi:diadenylate cyclase